MATRPKRKHSAQTRNKISVALKKYYASGGVRGARAAEKKAKRRVRTDVSIKKTTISQASLNLKQQILRLTKQRMRTKTGSPRSKAIAKQIQMLRNQRRRLAQRQKNTR